MNRSLVVAALSNGKVYPPGEGRYVSQMSERSYYLIFFVTACRLKRRHRSSIFYLLRARSAGTALCSRQSIFISPFGECETFFIFCRAFQRRSVTISHSFVSPHHNQGPTFSQIAKPTAWAPLSIFWTVPCCTTSTFRGLPLTGHCVFIPFVCEVLSYS